MECGTARIEITPPFAAALFGYPTDERTYTPHRDKVLDPLHARALYLQEGPAPGILILSLDVCILLTEDARALQRELATELGLPKEHILICATHTHSAPLPRYDGSGSEDEPTAKFIADPDGTSLRYGKWILGRLKKIATMALSRKAPATLAYRETFTGLGYDRRCPTSEGVTACWNIREFPERVPAPMERLRHSVMNFSYTNKPGGVILENLGIHPVVMGKESHQISGDWPRYARRHLEKRMGGYQAIFTMGPGAQVHPWISTQSEPKGLRWVGEAVGAEAHLLALMGDPVPLPEGALKVDTFSVPSTNIEITTVGLGPILIVGAPFELSTTWADQIRLRLNRPVVFLCLCNGWEGYWMSPGEFAEGGYEIEVATSKGISEKHSLALLERLQAYAG